MKYIIKIDDGYHSGTQLDINGKWCSLACEKSRAIRYDSIDCAKYMANDLKQNCVNATNAEIEEISE